MPPKALDLLFLLVSRPSELVTKEEILDSVWGDRFVSGSALTSRIKAARHAVGDDGSAQRVIRTVHGRGYQFVAKVEELPLAIKRKPLLVLEAGFAVLPFKGLFQLATPRQRFAARDFNPLERLVILDHLGHGTDHRKWPAHADAVRYAAAQSRDQGGDFLQAGTRSRDDADVAAHLLSEFLEQWDARQSTRPLEQRQNPEAIANYLAERYASRHQLMSTFQEAWAYFNRPEFRLNLALATAVL